MSNLINAGDECVVKSDIVINGQAAFMKGDLVKIEMVYGDPQRPGCKYAVYSQSLGKRLMLSGEYLVVQDSQQTKTCPYCAETIKAAAIKCRYCGSDLVTTASETAVQDKKKQEARVISDMKVGGKLAFSRNDHISVIRINPPPDNPKMRYVAFSSKLNTKVLLPESAVALTARQSQDSTRSPAPGASPSDKPRCPTCGSTDIERISGGSKVGAALMVGVFALGRISKTFKCNKCGYRW